MRHHLLKVGDLHLLQCSTNHNPSIKQVRVLVHVGDNSLRLRHSLSLGEYVRITYRNDVAVALEVLTLDRQFSNNVTLLLLVQIPPVNPL